ncbi:MAG: sulfoacetaldehyde dehydrogenase, partial [Burkholderiaceae bacterium]
MTVPNSDVVESIKTLMDRARAAQGRIDGYSQAQVDLMVSAVAWAILEPARNRELAELAVQDSGIGNADDKFKKNFRKTLG